MRPIFKYTLDEKTGQINVLTITDYEEKVSHPYSAFPNGRYWRYKRGTLFYVYERDLDKFKSGHVYTFNNSINHARQIIYDAIEAKYRKSYSEVDRWRKVIRRMEDVQKSDRVNLW